MSGVKKLQMRNTMTLKLLLKELIRKEEFSMSLIINIYYTGENVQLKNLQMR